MEFNDFINLLKKKRGTIFSLVFIIVIFSLSISLINVLKYEAKSRLLIVQNISGADSYTMSKSNEYIGNLFSQVVYSGSFYNLVLESSYNIDKNYFSGDYNSQIKKWNKTVQTKTSSDTGIIEINIYHPNPYQAQQIALAVNSILINKNANYQGTGQSIKVNVLDQPLVSNYPIKPNIPQNVLIALMASLLFSIFYIYIFPEESYSVRLWPKKKAKKIKNIKHSINLNYLSDKEINERLEKNSKLEYNFEPKQDSETEQNFNNKQNINNENEAEKSLDYWKRGSISNILK